MSRKKWNFSTIKPGMKIKFTLGNGTIFEVDAKDEAGFNLTLKNLVSGNLKLMRAGDFNYQIKCGGIDIVSVFSRN